jgi:hypothetical protein
MNRATPHLLIALALIPAALSAQTLSHPAIATAVQSDPAPPPAKNLLLRSTDPSPTSCPVGLSAKPGIGGNVMTIAASGGAGSQMLNVDLNNTGSHHIIAAKITAHGLTAHGHVIPANYLDAATTTKQVNLILAVAPGATESRNLLFKGFTSVSLIDLDSLTYADGSAWHRSPQHPCSIVPNPIMLVDTH